MLCIHGWQSRIPHGPRLCGYRWCAANAEMAKGRLQISVPVLQALQRLIPLYHAYPYYAEETEDHKGRACNLPKAHVTVDYTRACVGTCGDPSQCWPTPSSLAAIARSSAGVPTDTPLGDLSFLQISLLSFVTSLYTEKAGVSESMQKGPGIQGK